MPVRDQFTTDLRLAQRELQQTADTINTATARARHAIESVRDAAHAVFERRVRVFVPGIAMSSAYADSMCAKTFDRLECSRQFRRNRDAFDHIRVLEQPSHTIQGRVLNEFRALRAAP